MRTEFMKWVAFHLKKLAHPSFHFFPPFMKILWPWGGIFSASPLRM